MFVLNNLSLGNKLVSSCSSSDEDPVGVPRWVRPEYKDPYLLKMEKAPDDVALRPWANFDGAPTVAENTPDRSSPPLDEVELTASDEDDDGSVLELVIPVPRTRYRRVPTSSPKKTPKAPSLFCSLFCCLRK